MNPPQTASAKNVRIIEKVGQAGTTEPLCLACSDVSAELFADLGDRCISYLNQLGANKALMGRRDVHDPRPVLENVEFDG
jgi:hypothetical protein